MGVVSPEIHKANPSFWDAVIYDSYCEMNRSCVTLNETLMFVSFYDAPIVRTAYVTHTATIYITYEYCETSGNTCNEYRSYYGSANHTENIGGPGHIGDPYLYVSMTNYSSAGPNVYNRAQVTSPVAGTALVGTDTDGYVSTNGNISHPNSGSWSIPNVEWKTNATN